MVCLLDSDAQKEKEDTERLIKNSKNKYHLTFIAKGTFEDIFDLNFSIQILNELYPKGNAIVAADFNPAKDFLQNVSRIIFEKKKASFDKILFAKAVAFKVDPKDLPTPIAEVLQMATEFTTKGKFVRK